MIAFLNIASTCISFCQCAVFRDSRYSYYDDIEDILPFEERVPRFIEHEDLPDVNDYELVYNPSPYDIRYTPARDDEFFEQQIPRSWENIVNGPVKSGVNEILIIKGSFCKKNDTVSFVKNAVKVLEAVHEEFTANEEAKAVLEYIYEKLSTDPKKLALFVASSFYNTSFFTKFDSGSNKPFGARGPMMISGERNYERLASISKYDYTEAHCMLGDPTRMSVYHTIDFWTKFMYNSFYTLKKSFEKFVVDRESNATIDEPTLRNFKKIANGIYGFAIKK